MYADINSKYFYDLSTDSGYKTVNLKGIALIEDVAAGVRVALSVTDGNGQNVMLFTHLMATRLKRHSE